jgi:hypothetical protein
MPYRQLLLLTLLTLAAVGVATMMLVLPARPGALHAIWWVFLVILPLALATVVFMGWAWVAMACVAYGTIGLALDFATMVSILGGREGSDLTLAISVISGSANFLLIVIGGRAVWSVLQGHGPR